MSGYKGHIVGGLTLVGLYAFAVSFAPVQKFAEAADILHDWQALAAVFVVGILFAIFPDVDTNSKAQDILYWFVFLLDILLIVSGLYKAAAFFGLIALLPILSHHRGWTHKIWAMILVPLPIIIFPYLYDDTLLSFAAIYYGAAVVGYFSHLLLDGIIWRRLTR